jgi:hypothetical protein
MGFTSNQYQSTCLFPAIAIHNRPTSSSVRNRHYLPHAKLLSIPYAHGVLYFQTTQGTPLVLIACVSNVIYQVDAAILEVGIGGRSDSTNIVPKPIVTGVTALGYDHTRILGDRLHQIANQKGGIYKARFSVVCTFQLLDSQPIGRCSRPDC